ncbi:MAG: UDP-N-acetylmuramate dehydrogenase [Bacteroidaceae bacterium]|nr:UDP-N-acetylmuramate dehydrogenase [Bacteroidaceae bacterium]
MIKQFNRYSLLSHNTFGIEATANQFVEFSSVDDIVGFLGEGYDGRSFVIGGGSNLLFVNDYNGTILHSAIMGMQVVEEDDNYLLLRVGSGVNWDALVAYTVEQGWGGLENLSAIPGEVGASAVQNVGAYGVEAGELIAKVETVRLSDALCQEFLHDDCCFSYRHSIFKAAEKGKHIITHVTYRLSKNPTFKLTYGNLSEKVGLLGGATLANVRKAVCEIREAKLPSPDRIGSAGSFFMNPIVPAEVAEALVKEYPAMPQYPLTCGNVKLSAGWLIEQCGWKETPHEHVGVYKHQALVVINRGGATGRDVLDFASAVVASVKEKFGVELNMEVNVIG